MPYEGRVARSRLRVCEVCRCKAESVEAIIRVLNTGESPLKPSEVLSEKHQQSLF